MNPISFDPQGMQASKPTQAQSPARNAADAPVFEPQDLATTLGILVVLKTGEALMASYFMAYLPLWMPLTWIGLVWVSGAVFFWMESRQVLHAWPVRRRIHGYRVLYWTNMACMGSAAYFLYVPHNLGMQGVLTTCLVTVGALNAMQYAGDNWRGAVSAGLAILPVATRYIVLEEGLLYMSLGLGGYLIVTALAMMGYKQQEVLLEQAAMRQRAEAAADAVAAVGLAKARFFAAVSHDLRQPVHAIGLYLALLQEGTRAGGQDATQAEPPKKAVDGIYQSWHALDGLLSQVLDLTRMDSGSLEAEMTTVEVAPLVRGLVLQHSAAAEKKSIRIVALVAPQRYVHADLLMLKRVLSNLLDNAIKFSPEDSRIVLALRPAGKLWSIQVRDAGPGIATASQGQVFEEFVQLSNPQRDREQGLGLGLAIAKRFTELMQGRLRLRSAPGAGTCMSVLLQRAQPEPSQYTQSGTFESSKLYAPDTQTQLQVSASLRKTLQASDKTVLLVEDDELVSQALKQLFADLQLPLLRARHAEEAMALASQACVAVCDVRLPYGASGLDLADSLLQIGIPALLMTGETSSDVREAAQRKGLILLVKPVKPQALLDGLARLAERVTQV
jgi:two-component system, sensor histidine kinase